MNFGVTDKKTAELFARMEKCGLKESDIEETFVRSSGPGGQKVNKTSSCALLKHKPSGLQVKMQKERSLGLNRFFARRRLCELLEESMGVISTEKRKSDKIRKQKQRRKRRSRSASASSNIAQPEITENKAE